TSPSARPSSFVTASPSSTKTLKSSCSPTASTASAPKSATSPSTSSAANSSRPRHLKLNTDFTRSQRSAVGRFPQAFQLVTIELYFSVDIRPFFVLSFPMNLGHRHDLPTFPLTLPHLSPRSLRSLLRSFAPERSASPFLSKASALFAKIPGGGCPKRSFPFRESRRGGQPTDLQIRPYRPTILLRLLRRFQDQG